MLKGVGNEPWQAWLSCLHQIIFSSSTHWHLSTTLNSSLRMAVSRWQLFWYPNCNDTWMLFYRGHVIILVTTHACCSIEDTWSFWFQFSQHFYTKKQRYTSLVWIQCFAVNILMISMWTEKESPLHRTNTHACTYREGVRQGWNHTGMEAGRRAVGGKFRLPKLYIHRSVHLAYSSTHFVSRLVRSYPRMRDNQRFRYW